MPRRGVSFSILFTLVLLAAAAASAQAAEAALHVSLSGSDTTGDGSVSSPFRTIQKAVDAAQATSAAEDDEIRVQQGTYAEPGVDLAISIPASANTASLAVLGGFNGDFTVQTAATTVFVPQQTGSIATPDLEVLDGDVTVDGFHFVFDGTVGAGGTRPSRGLLLAGPDAVLANNTIEAGNSSGASAPDGYAVIFESGSGTLTITGNSIVGNAQHPTNGVLLDPSGSDLHVHVSGGLMTGSNVGLRADGLAQLVVEDVDIDGNANGVLASDLGTFRYSGGPDDAVDAIFVEDDGFLAFTDSDQQDSVSFTDLGHLILDLGDGDDGCWITRSAAGTTICNGGPGVDGCWLAELEVNEGICNGDAGDDFCDVTDFHFGAVTCSGGDGADECNVDAMTFETVACAGDAGADSCDIAQVGPPGADCEGGPGDDQCTFGLDTSGTCSGATGSDSCATPYNADLDCEGGDDADTCTYGGASLGDCTGRAGADTCTFEGHAGGSCTGGLGDDSCSVIGEGEVNCDGGPDNDICSYLGSAAGECFGGEGSDLCEVVGAGADGVECDGGEGDDMSHVELLSDLPGTISVLDSGLTGTNALGITGSPGDDDVLLRAGPSSPTGREWCFSAGGADNPGESGTSCPAGTVRLAVTDTNISASVLGGAGADRFVVASAPAGSDLDGGEGSDAYRLRGADLAASRDLRFSAGPLTVSDTGSVGANTLLLRGTSGSDSLRVRIGASSGSWCLRVEATEDDGAPGAACPDQAVRLDVLSTPTKPTLHGGRGTDMLGVAGAALPAGLVLNGQRADDTYSFAPLPGTGMKATVADGAPGGTDSLVFKCKANVVVRPGKILVAGQARIAYSGVESRPSCP
jgi:Protein of unknown function (DUF1565)